MPLDFNITSTWDGKPLGKERPVQLHLSGSPDGEHLEVSIIAPFYDDPPSSDAPSGESVIPLYRDEVVEAYFLNDEDQYFQVQLTPRGHYQGHLYNGERVWIRFHLPLMTTARINRESNTWTGLIKIPVDYLPRNVTKFNAFAMHGANANRQFWSLFPSDGSLTEPDFHALQFFEEVDFTQILPNLPEESSQLWLDAVEGIFRYHIKTEWNSKPVTHEPVEIKLQGFEAGVEMNVTAPFFNDPKPDGPSGQPFYGLWDYEVVEMFFLNDNDEYLEVELGPWGQHLLLLLKGARNAIKHSMPLDYIAQVPTTTDGKWTGSALIPPEYFPPNVTRINAYAIHGTDKDRVYESLFPAPENDLDYPQPDFHRLELFKPIDFQFQMPNNSEYSQLWQDAMTSGGKSSTGISPVVKDEEEVEITTTLGLRDEDEEFVTTFAPETARPFSSSSSSTRRRGGQGGSSTRRRRPMPHRVDTQVVPRGQSRKEDQSLFQQRRGEAQFFNPGPVPRPHQVRGTAPGRFQDRVLVSEAADQNRNVDQRFSQGNDGFQNQGFQFQDQGRPQVAFQDQGRPQVAFQNRDRFEESRPFQNQGQFRPPQQDRNRFEETRPFQNQGQPQQDRFEETLPFQSQGQFRPPQQFQGQGQQQFLPPQQIQEQTQQQFLPPQRFQEQGEQLFQTRPEAPAFQERDQYEEPQSFPQGQDPQVFLAPQPDEEQFETQPPFFPEEEEEEEAIEEEAIEEEPVEAAAEEEAPAEELPAEDTETAAEEETAPMEDVTAVEEEAEAAGGQSSRSDVEEDDGPVEVQPEPEESGPQEPPPEPEEPAKNATQVEQPEDAQEPVVMPVTEGKNRSGQDAVSSYDLPKELMPIHPGGGSKFEDLEQERLDKTKMSQTKADDDDAEDGNAHNAEGLYSTCSVPRASLLLAPVAAVLVRTLV
ncbi:uncharacterized protein LOC119591909 isoform X2 [Penaeus monodon]|uniref:uncharacterized protein LOC119591909 isoform X2 n=1 Tax=Penaeus monodon TaxID=6687 RepID=UPI0018A6D4CA|nr:uncharacterized protein LOC119591909 isoform X2 [Penaeus monodon]